MEAFDQMSDLLAASVSHWIPVRVHDDSCSNDRCVEGDLLSFLWHYGIIIPLIGRLYRTIDDWRTVNKFQKKQRGAMRNAVVENASLYVCRLIQRTIRDYRGMKCREPIDSACLLEIILTL
jgi:hypothetical protein